MLIKKWEKLPEFLKIEEVRPYWEKLRKRNWNLFWKRVFDILVSFILLLILFPLFLILAIAIKIDSKGPVFYRQVRYTQYGKEFRIHKFRSMTVGADKGGLVTVKNDSRVTKVGRIIRKLKLDEISQLLDVLSGKMTFVGTRPEVKKYIDAYQNEYLATLLLPAGITSMASVKFKDENDMLDGEENADDAYVEKILPIKMKYNLEEIQEEGMFHDIKIMFMTFFSLFKKEKSNSTTDEKREQKK